MSTPSAAPASVSRALVAGGWIALAGLTLLYPSTSRMLVWPWALAGAALWLAPVLVLLVRLACVVEFRLPPPLVTAGIALLAVTVCVSASTGPFAAASLPRVWPTLGGCAVYLLLHDALARQPDFVAPSTRWLAVLGALVVLASTALWLQFAPTSRNAYPFGHSNYTAGFLVLLLPWLALQAWTGRGLLRVAWLGAMAVALYALVGSSSRAGALGLVAGSAIATAVVLARAPWSWTRKLLVVVAFGLIALGALITNERLRRLFVERTWSESALASNLQRSAMRDAGWQLGSQRPWLGWGPGSVPLAYPSVRASLDGGAENVLQLHSTPLQLWATLGAAGVIAACALLAGALFAIRHTGFTPPAIAALASLGGYAIVALTDHQLDIPAIVALSAFSLAVVTHTSLPRRLDRRRPLVFAASAACLALLIPLQSDLRARHAYARGLDALDARDIAASLSAFDRASEIAPHDPYFQHRAADTLLTLREATADPARRLQLTRDAAHRLERSLAAGVHREFPHFNLGWLYLEMGEPAKAARHFTAAARLVPDKGGVYFGLGLALLETGRSAHAIRAFALEALNDPRSAHSPAWETSALAPLRPAIRAEVTRLYTTIPRAYSHTEALWWRWWSGEHVDTGELRGVSLDSRYFWGALDAISRRQPVNFSFPWAVLYRAWLARDFSSLDVAPTVQVALGRRARRHGDDFIAFLRAGSEDEPALIRTLRRSRPGYGMLALHPAGSPFVDAYLVQEMIVHADFAAALFPAKGSIPGRFLLPLLPELGPA
ncbi:MAG TPA: O-antigen ligase family protein, partial [Opitutaceae bacterium]